MMQRQMGVAWGIGAWCFVLLLGALPCGWGAPVATVVNHGDPNPMATFRFAEPVPIDKQQNFRVEIAFPRGVPPRLASVRGPLHVWVVLDGYLKRDVQ